MTQSAAYLRTFGQVNGFVPIIITQVAYTLLSIPLSGFSASINASDNPEASDKHHHYADPRIYSYGSSVELEGVCDYHSQ